MGFYGIIKINYFKFSLKYPMLNKEKNSLGFTLVEVIVSLAIIVFIMISVYNLIIMSLRITAGNSSHVEAMEIAKQKIEYVHSLSYKNVGTVMGDPKGIIPDCEIINRTGIFEICYEVEYKDDSFDKLITDTPADTNPSDYKVVTVKVSWETSNGPKEISVYTKVVSSTMEVNEGQGLLRILVTDTGYLDAGKVTQPVENAKININNPLLGINIDRITDSNGIINYLASSSEGYEITVIHNADPNDWGTDMTYGTSTDRTPQHLTVFEGAMTYEQFTIDKKGIINIKTVKASNLPEIWQINNSNLNRLQKNIKVSKDPANNLYFIWESEVATSTHVYIQKYNNASPPASLWTNDIKISDTLFQKNPDIVTSDSGYSYIAWQDNSITLRNIAYAPASRFVRANPKNSIRLVSPDDLGRKNVLAWDNLRNYFSGFNTDHKIKGLVFRLDAFKNDIFDYFEKKETQFALAAASDYYGLKTQAYTGQITGNNTVADVFLTDPVDPDHAFVLMHSWWTTARECGLGPIGGGCQPDEHQATAHFDPSGMKVIVERSGIPNDDSADKNLYFSFYVIEAVNEEFVVRDRSSMTILYDQSSSTELMTAYFNNSDKLTLISNSRLEMDYVAYVDSNYLGYATAFIYDDGGIWRVKSERGGISPGSEKYNTIVRYELVEWLSPLIDVQTGEISGAIGTTENTFNLISSPDHYPVELDRTWLYASMYHESNGIARTSVRIRLVDSDTIGYVRADGTHNSTLRWWTVEFPRGVAVQRGSDFAASSDNNESVTLGAAVVLENSWSDSYRACDESNFTREEFPRDRWTETLSDASTLSWWRRSDGEEVYFYYQVIDTSNWDRPVEIIATGTQIVTLDSPSANQYIGGVFVISKENFSADISSITITEHGSVDAENKLDNIRLQYDIDITAPYICDDQSYNAGDAAFGATDTDGFSGANGTSTFVKVPALQVSPAGTICLYVVMDITGDVNKYDTLDIKINNPKENIILDTGTGYIKDTAQVRLDGDTELLLPPIPEQSGYAWREDDGDEPGASAYPENQFIIKKPGDPIRIRIAVNNSGSKILSTTYKLKYGLKNNNSCGAVVAWSDLNAGGDWNSFNSAFMNEGDGTADLAFISNPNTVFFSGSFHDTGDITGYIDLEHNNFTELEFSIISDVNLEDGEYCFRLEKEGDNSSFVYPVYPEVTIIGDYNIFIKKIDNSTGAEIWVKQVNTNENPYQDKLRPRVALTKDEAGNDSPVVVWYDDYNDIYAQKFDSAGNKLWNGGIDQVIASTTAIETFPSLKADSENDLVITWIHNSEVALGKFSSSTGVLLWTATTTVDADNNNSLAEISIDNNDNYYIAWQKNNNVRVSKYSSTAAFLWSINANHGNIADGQSNPSLMIDNINNFIYTSWADDRLGDWDIYTQKINLNTAAYTWPDDYRINFNTGGDDQYNPALIMRGADPVVAWQDNNLALGAKFRPEGPTSLVIEANVNLTATSTKTISNNPATPKVIENFQTDSSGDASIYTEHDFSGYNFFTTGANSIYVSDPAMPIALEPDQIKNITIYVD